MMPESHEASNSRHNSGNHPPTTSSLNSPTTPTPHSVSSSSSEGISLSTPAGSSKEGTGSLRRFKPRPPSSPPPDAAVLTGGTADDVDMSAASSPTGSPYPPPRNTPTTSSGPTDAEGKAPKRKKKKRKSLRKSKKRDKTDAVGLQADEDARAVRSRSLYDDNNTDGKSPPPSQAAAHQRTDSLGDELTSTSLGLAKARGSRGVSAIVDVDAADDHLNYAERPAHLEPVGEAGVWDDQPPVRPVHTVPVIAVGSTSSSSKSKKGRIRRSLSRPTSKGGGGGSGSGKKRLGFLPRVLSNTLESRRSTSRRHSDSCEGYEAKEASSPPAMDSSSESGDRSPELSPIGDRGPIPPIAYPSLERETSAPAALSSSPHFALNSDAGRPQAKKRPSGGTAAGAGRQPMPTRVMSEGVMTEDVKMRATSWIRREEQVDTSAVAASSSAADGSYSVPTSPKLRPEKTGRSRFGRHRKQKSTDAGGDDTGRGRKRAFSSGIKFSSRSRSQKAVRNRRAAAGGGDAGPVRTKTGGGVGAYASLSSKSLGGAGPAAAAAASLSRDSSPKGSLSVKEAGSSKPSIFNLFSSRSNASRDSPTSGSNGSSPAKGSGGFARGLFSKAIVPETHQSQSRLDTSDASQWETMVFEKVGSESNGGRHAPHPPSTRPPVLLSPSHGLSTSPVLYTQMSDRILDMETPDDSSRESSMLDSDESSVHSTRSTPATPHPASPNAAAGVDGSSGAAAGGGRSMTTPHSAPAPLNLATVVTQASLSYSQKNPSQSTKSMSSSSSASSKGVVASPASAPHTPHNSSSSSKRSGKRGIKPFRRRNKQQQQTEKSQSRSTSSGVSSGVTQQQPPSHTHDSSSPAAATAGSSDESANSQGPSTPSRERPTMRDLTSVSPTSMYRADSTRTILPEANFQERPRSRRDAYYAEVARELEQETVLCDFMKKKSRKEVLKTHAWLERFWSLDRFKMTGFKRKDPQAVGVEIELWKILKVIDHPQSKHDGCRFDIVTNDAQTYSILTKNSETREKWVNFLNEYAPIRANEKLAYYI